MLLAGLLTCWDYVSQNSGRFLSFRHQRVKYAYLLTYLHTYLSQKTHLSCSSAVSDLLLLMSRRAGPQLDAHVWSLPEITQQLIIN